MPNWRKHFPEADCAGDPYLDEIMTTDDWIIDYRYNAVFLGIDPAVGETTARVLEASRLAFELEALTSWWHL